MQRAIKVVLMCEGTALPDDATILSALQRVIDTSRLDANITIGLPSVDLTQPPELDHDRMMAAKYQHKVGAHGKSERRVIWNLFQHLASHGWNPVALTDSDRVRTATPDAKSAMELLFNLDDAWVHVTDGKREHWLRFVLGNAPDEVLSDYSYSESSGFAAIVEAFNATDFV